MAVEARHFNLCNREMMMNGVVEGNNNGNLFGAYPIGFGVIPPPTENVFPMFGTAVADLTPPPSLKASDSGLTYAVPAISRKQRSSRDPILLSSFPNHVVNSRCTFLGEDISHQIQQQQLDIDRFVAQHTEKVRSEIEDRRKRNSRRFAAAIEEHVTKRLKSKDDEIERIGKLNWALEEKVKSLCVENQIWRDLAQTNEATANTLRCNLEQILNQFHHEQQQQQQIPTADDAQSCCDSNEKPEWRTLADCATSGAKMNGRNNRMCRGCGKEESCVLVLPCRHLCLCTVCGSTVHACPVCNSVKTATLHVNLSSS